MEPHRRFGLVFQEGVRIPSEAWVQSHDTPGKSDFVNTLMVTSSSKTKRVLKTKRNGLPNIIFSAKFPKKILST